MLKTDTFMANEQLFEKFFDSVALVITKANEEEEYYVETLKAIIEYLNNSPHLTSRQKLTLKLVTSVY